VGVGVPVQVPVVVVSVLPSWAVPEIVGKAVLTGVLDTSTVWALLAVALPPALVAVTAIRIVFDKSEATGL
jgi:hypothetical protein